jgi:catechol 2,3-dioxygenase-like lactoylglutathione lyase family enzyme
MIRGLMLGIAAGGVLSGAALAADLPPLTPETRPIRASGVGLNVSDIERSKAFYTEVLGFKVGARIPAQGPAKEYLLGLTGDIRADSLVVLTAAKPAPGATSFGRVVLVAPSGRALAERAAAAGFPPAKIVDGTNFIKDPDGYTIELYQRPAAPAR